MKTTSRKLHLLLVMVGCLCLLLIIRAPLALAGNQVFVSTTLLQATCDFHIESHGVDVTNLSLGNVDSSLLVINGAMGIYHPLQLVFSECGLPASGLMPAVRLTGTQAKAEDVPGSNKYMFRNEGADGGSSKGYFIFIADNTSASWPGITGTETGVYGYGDYIPVGKVGESGQGARKTFYLGVGCGGNCTAQDTFGGTVKANFVFSFTYR